MVKNKQRVKISETSSAKSETCTVLLNLLHWSKIAWKYELYVVIILSFEEMTHTTFSNRSPKKCVNLYFYDGCQYSPIDSGTTTFVKVQKIPYYSKMKTKVTLAKIKVTKVIFYDVKKFIFIRNRKIIWKVVWIEYYLTLNLSSRRY